MRVMKHWLHIVRSWRPRTLALLVLLVSAVASLFWMVDSEQQHRSVLRATTTRAAAGAAFNLRQALDADLRVLDLVVVLLQQGQGEVAGFETQVGKLLHRAPDVASVGLLPDGVLAHSAPAEDTPRDMGRNVLEGPHKHPDAVRAFQEGRRIVSEPEQGADGHWVVWVYQPIYLGASEAAVGGSAPPPFPGDWWGLVRMAIDLEGLLASSRLDQVEEQGYDYELVSWADPVSPQDTREALAASQSLTGAIDDPVEMDTSLYDLKWRLRLVPTGGWSSSSTLRLKIAWATLFCGAMSVMAYLLGQRLQLTRSLLQNLTDHVPGVLYQYRVQPDGRARFQYLSPGIEALVGLSQEALSRSDASWWERLVQEDGTSLQNALKGALVDMDTFETDFRMHMPDGSVRWFWTRAQPQRQDDGAVVWHGYLADWTTEKQTEDALLQSSHLLTEAQEVARLGYFFTDVRSGRWTSSTLLDDILGIGADFERTTEGWNSLVDPAYRDSLRDSYQAAVAARTGFNVEYPLCRPLDGRMIWVHLMGRLEFDDQGRPTRLVGTVQDISARKKAEADIRSLAYYDPLTGLPNRRLLLDRLSQALAERAADGQHGALMFIDLDHFKDLNDTLGHDKGDALLRMVALRLLSCVGEHDTVARLGGDEFVLLLDRLEVAAPDGQGPVDPTRAVEDLGLTLVSTLSRPYPLGGGQHTSTPSIGVALFSNDGLSVDDVLKRADVAMYQAKAAGRNTLRFYDPSIQAELADRLRLAEDLRAALLGDQLFLQYQPQHDASGALVGAEALLRWRHPVRGMVSPAVFIPLAEQVGQMEVLGQWVLNTACRQLSEWLTHHPLAQRHPGFTLAVNVSAHQFRSRTVVADVQRALCLTQLPPGVLKLELTESLMVHDVEDIIAKMNEIRMLGVLFSLDDFGTGYSSLTYLKRLPLDQLKIDQSFVRDVLTSAHDAAIARTVVALGQTLGLEVMAEGVETTAQRAYLHDLGCTRYQGYLFSKPLNADDFLAYALQEN